MKRSIQLLFSDISHWMHGWYVYIEHKLVRFGARFDAQKSVLVDVLMAKRGTYQRPFLHLSLGMIFAVGFLSAPILADSYPGSLPSTLNNFTPPSAVVTSLDSSEYGVTTQSSKRPRDQVVVYTVVDGDTLARIADKFNISVDSIKWANSLIGDNLKIGQDLKIPPVSGIVYKVKDGDTVYSIAKKFKTEAQKIIDFPFNDYDLDTFALSAGQTLIVPDGVIEIAPAIVSPIPPVFAGGTGQFQWPVSGVITQYPVWYHQALDIANPGAPGIAAADSGTVIVVSWDRYGYGNYAIVSHGNGLSTLYAHMQAVYVKSGDVVARGQIIGKMGSTGRSTGTHLHFEIRKNNVTVNPLPFLK